MKTTEGKIGLHQEITVSSCQMKDWPPERIQQFFEGIAQMIRCVRRHHLEPNPFPHCTPSAPPRSNPDRP
jgi:hypothetical protein